MSLSRTSCAKLTVDRLVFSIFAVGLIAYFIWILVARLTELRKAESLGLKVRFYKLNLSLQV